MPIKEATFEWIKRIVNSCETRDHRTSAQNLMELFYKKYNDLDLYTQLRWDLHNITINNWRLSIDASKESYI